MPRKLNSFKKVTGEKPDEKCCENCNSKFCACCFTLAFCQLSQPAPGWAAVKELQHPSPRWGSPALSSHPKGVSPKVRLLWEVDRNVSLEHTEQAGQCCTWREIIVELVAEIKLLPFLLLLPGCDPSPAAQEAAEGLWEVLYTFCSFNLAHCFSPFHGVKINAGFWGHFKRKSSLLHYNPTVMQCIISSTLKQLSTS